MTSAIALALSLLVAPSADAGLRSIPLPPPPIVAFPAPEPPAIDAAAWMLYSVEQEAELGSKNPDQVRASASITKLMTAILVVEHADPSAVATISANADATPIGFVGQPDVRQGEIWLVEELLANILVQSGNDAAVALAEHVAGSVEEFVVLMNERAAELGMIATAFRNPNGLDESGHVSTARDLVKLGVEALQHPVVMRTVRIKHISFAPGGREIEVDATNRLLGVFPGYFGLKTGDTAAAGQVLLSYVESGHERLIGVVLGSSGRRVATRELMAWGLTTLGPRDHFLAAAAGTETVAGLPEWYQVRLLAAQGALDTGDPSPPPTTPGREALLAAFRDLLPSLLGGEQ